MLSRTILVALVSAACFAIVNAQDQNTCSAKNEKCCQQLQDSKNLDATVLGLLNFLNVDVDALTGDVGVQCIDLLGGTCTAQTACCTGNSYGLVVVNCSPISL